MTLLLTLAMTALALSCTKTDRVYDGSAGEVCFSPVGDVMHRSADTKTLDYPDEGVFGVFARHADCPGGTAWNDQTAFNSSVPYLENVAFGKNGENWAGCNPSDHAHTPYYWPLSGSLMFAGYSPHKEVSEGTITEVTFVTHMIEGYVNPYLMIDFTQNETPGQMTDLLWFDVGDVAAGKTVGKTSDPVAFEFRHALSKVSFSFVDSNRMYKLKEVSLTGCVNSAVFYSGMTAGWSPKIDVLADYKLLAEQIQPENMPLLNGWESSELYVIPQYLDGVFPVVGTGANDTGVDVKLAFTLTGNEGYGSENIEILLHDCTKHWIMGYHYHYQVTLEADPIHFGAPEVSITPQMIAL